nr:multidrug transporter [uncultured Eisenbergiella sp.]
MIEPTKRDWKLFREKIAEWQEDYMERLVKQYTEFLSGELPASTKFWELEKRIKNDKRSPGVLIQLKKSTMIWDIVSLINDGVIKYEDLDEFGDGLKENVRIILERQ